jgi:transposase
MWAPSRNLDVFVYRHPVDMRKSFDGLSALAKHTLEEDPLGGALFVFVNRRRTQMKCLYFDGDGYCVWAKRLERGCFQVQWKAPHKVRIDMSTLRLLIEGIAPQSVHRFKRYSRPLEARVLV